MTAALPIIGTLADIPLYARHLLFILSSCFLHASCPIGSCRWPAGVGSACAADGQMFDSVDQAGAEADRVDVPGDLSTYVDFRSLPM
jgi:hypothetical protein